MKITWKKGQMLPTFDYTITVFNKLSYQDSASGLDVWEKTVLHNCYWGSKAVRSVQGTTVSIGSAFVVRVPKNDAYKPYSEWKNDFKDGFTFSTGDFIVKGEVTEEVTAANIKKVIAKYRPEAFEVRLFRDNTGTIEALEHYHIEGV